MDVCLLCFERGYNVSFFIDDHDADAHPECVDGFEVLANAVGEGTLHDLAKVPEGNQRLFFVFCRADFHQGSVQTLNHFMPAYHMDALGSENFEVLWLSAQAQLTEELVALQTRMSDSLNVWPTSSLCFLYGYMVTDPAGKCLEYPGLYLNIVCNYIYTYSIYLYLSIY